MKTKLSRFPTHQKNLRADAAWVIYQVLEHGRSCRELMPLVFERHEQKQKAWLQEMIYGCLRDIPRLQMWLRELLQKPLKGEQKPIEHLIMLGFYQLSSSRIQDHAVVSETVNAVELLGSFRLKGLVNGVLRNFQRSDLMQDEVTLPHVKTGLPKWLYKQLLGAYPQQIEEIAINTNQRPPIWLRVNQAFNSVEDYELLLNEDNIKFSKDEYTKALLLQDKTDIISLPKFQEGAFSVQDKAAQHAALLLDVQPNERVLDCCAAPGGKTAHIIESQTELKTLTAIDLEPARLKRVHENMQRLGHDEAFSSKLSIECHDAASFKVEDATKLFDKVLLDAPCSATGVIRRHPDIRWLRKKDDIANLVALQAAILDNIWQSLKPGGTLLYATCSILPMENTEQVKAFLARTKDASIHPINHSDTQESPGWQILPGDGQMDGFYYARLIKSA